MKVLAQKDVMELARQRKISPDAMSMQETEGIEERLTEIVLTLKDISQRISETDINSIGESLASVLREVAALTGKKEKSLLSAVDAQDVVTEVTCIRDVRGFLDRLVIKRREVDAKI